MVEDRTQLQTQPPMRRQERIPGHLRAHLAIAQDEVRKHGEHRPARRALDAPDGDPTQPNTRIMRMARQAPSSAAGRLVFQLKAQGQEKGEHKFEKRLAVAKQLKVGRFILKINRDGAVFTGLAGCIVPGSSSGQMVAAADDPKWRDTCTISRKSRRAEIPHHIIRWNVLFLE